MNSQQFDPMASSHSVPSTASSSHSTSPSPPLAGFNAAQMQHMQIQGFPVGMIHALSPAQIKHRYPLRVWILDNGSAMQARDAHILRTDYTSVPVSRWEELRDCIGYHADMNMRLGLPTRFALLNAPVAAVGGVPPPAQYMSLHQTPGDVNSCQTWLAQLSSMMPQGPSPLLTQLKILRDYIASIAPQLRAQNQCVPIMIGTQGLLTDDQGHHSPALGQALTNMLLSFDTFPVSFVLRLCTDDEKAFEFYNSVDARLPTHITLDVLDDFYGEALEVYLRNPWLCYAIVLHRYREMGYSHVAVLDFLDERALGLEELREFLQFLFGGLPDPRADWSHFLQAVQHAMARERPHWNPVLKKVTPWININLLHSIYGAAASPPFRPHQPAAAPSPFATATPQGQGQQPQYYQQQQHQQQQQHYQQQPPPFSSPPVGAPGSRSNPPSGVSSMQQQNQPTAKPQTSTQLTTALDRHWAKNPPSYTNLRPISVLLGTLHTTRELLPTPTHPHLQKFHALSPDALAGNDPAVLKKAVRKVRLWLHPDKLPPADELSEMERVWCRSLWDTISEAWSHFEDNRKS